MQNKRSKKELTRLILTALILGSGGLYGPVAEAADIEVKGSPTAVPSTILTNNTYLMAWPIDNNTWTLNYTSSDNAWTSYSAYGAFNGIGGGQFTLQNGIIQRAFGNYRESGIVSGGIVNINGGNISSGLVYGGMSSNSDADGNTVRITGGTFRPSGDDHEGIYGGYSYGGDAKNNAVIISGGTFTKDSYGRTVAVYGGRSTKSGKVATDNSVTIDASVDLTNLFGGYAINEGGNGDIYWGGNNTLYLGANAKNATVKYNVGGFDTIALTSDFAFEKGKNVLSALRIYGGTHNTVFDIHNATTLLNDTDVSHYGTMTLLSSTGTGVEEMSMSGIKLNYNNTAADIKAYTSKDVKSTSITNDTASTTVRLDGTRTHTVANNGSTITYTIANNISTVTFGDVTWGTTPRTLTLNQYTFGSGTTIDKDNLTFTNPEAVSGSMTLLAGATGITGSSITHSQAYNKTVNGTTLGLTLNGSITRGSNAITYTATGRDVKSIDLTGWTGSTYSIGTDWASGLTNNSITAEGFTEPDENTDIFTTNTAGFFNDTYITGSKKYSGGTELVNDTDKGVTLTGYKGGGVKATDSGKKLSYFKEMMDTQSITLGEMTWGTPRVANSSYDFSEVNSIDASGLTFTGTATAADASTNLLTGATGLGTTSYTITQPTNAAVAAEFTDGNSIAYKGTGTGEVSVDGTNVKFTINSGTLSNINLGGWTGTQNMSLPTNWTGTNIAVDTGDFDALTEDKTLFSLGANTFGTVSGAKVYKDSETVTDDKQNGVSLSGVKSGGIKVEDSGAKLQYYAETMNANGITLGNMTWGTGRAIGTGYNFANVGANGVDATNLTFDFTGDTVNTLAVGSDWNLLTGATGLSADLEVKGSPVSQKVSYGIDNVATLGGTLTGKVKTTADTVNYAVTGKTLDSVDISGWNGTATATVDSSWSKAASGISVTGSGFVTPDTVGEYNILTYGSTGFFTGAKIDSSFAYQPSGTYSETAQNITLSGKQGKGVLANSEGTSLQYKIGEAYIDNIKLGAVSYSKDAELLDKSGSLYNYSQLTSLDTSGFSLTMTDDQKKEAAADDSMTLVKGNSTLSDIEAQSAGDSKYSYEATTGLTVGGTVSGSVSATGNNVVYQVTGNTASTLDVTSATWDTTYARPNTEISYKDAVVDSSNITFFGVDNLNAGDTMTLVSNYGSGVKKTRAGVFTLSNGLKGKGYAYYDSGSDSLMYKVTLGAGETQATVDAVGNTEIFIQPDGGAPYQGTINGGEAKGGGTSKGNKTKVKGGVITNTDGTGGDVNGGTSEEGDSKKNKADVEDSTIAGDVNGGKSDNGNATDNEADVDHSNVGGDVNGGSTNGDGETKGNEANVKNGSKVTGNVTGGRSGGNGDCTGNAAEVESSEVGGDVNGGQSDGNGNTRENKTHVKDSKVTGNVIGGHSGQNDGSGGNGESTGNTAEVEGSEVGGNVNGGRSEQGNANKNESTVSGGSKVTGDVTGGSSGGTGNANENKTTVEGGSEIGGNVIGGQSNGGNTNKNETTVSGGSTVNGDVTGGKTSGTGTSSENKTNVDGSSVGGSVIGGQSVDGDASKNETNVSGGSTVTGDVLGGKTTSTGNANENKTNVDGSNVGGNVIGGYSQSGNASANETSVFGGSVGGSVYGGKTDGASEASSNTVTMDGGAVINGAVYGGYSENGAAEGNIVTVKNATIRDYIYGGKSKIRSSNDLVYFHDGSVLGIIGGGCDEAISNSVTLMKGGVEEHVIGGYATTTATGNKVTITGGTVQGSVIGGYGNGTANDNSVYLGGGTVQGNTIDSATLGVTIEGGVYGGYGAGATRNNSVSLYSTADVSNTGLFGGTSEATGNILNIGYDGAAWTGGSQNVKNISNFENIKYSVLPWNSAKAAVTITDGTASNLSAATVSAPQVTITGVKTLSTGDTMTLLDQSKVAAANQAIKVKENSNFTIGIAAEGTGLLSRDEQGNVIYKVDSIKATEQTHNTVMASAAGMAALTTGNDYIGAAGEGLFHPENIGADGLACYAKIGGGKLRQETGSHVNVNTWNAILAVGRKSEHKDSTFEYGAFVEYGNGKFSTFNENSQRGDGSANYTGAGLLGKWTAKNGLYVDGSFRAGRIHENTTNILRDNIRGYGYDERSTYLGFSLGIGKQFEAAKGDVVDVYGRYIFNRKGSMDFNAAGDDYNLDAINSHIFRLGVRYTMKRDRWKFYGDLSYEHEFDGKAEGRVNGLTIRGADTSGGSARLELGATLTPSAESPWSLNFDVTGYAGKKQGIKGGVSLTYMF